MYTIIGLAVVIPVVILLIAYGLKRNFNKNKQN